MKIDIPSENNELTVVSFVNGVLICINESVDDYYEDGIAFSKKNQLNKKKFKKNPEDNLGNVVSFIDTDKIERGVDFGRMKCDIESILSKNSWSMADFFKNDDIVADFCEHYEYTLQDFIRLMIEHMPSVMNINFLRTVIRPTIISWQKTKNEFYNGTEEKTGYRRIFAYL